MFSDPCDLHLHAMHEYFKKHDVEFVAVVMEYHWFSLQMLRIVADFDLLVVDVFWIILFEMRCLYATYCLTLITKLSSREINSSNTC